MLLIRWGRIPKPPPEAIGQNYGIEYVGPLALALQNQQAQGFVRWAGDAIQLAEAFPAVLDLVNIDSGFRRYGENLGVNVDDVNSDETVAALRQARAEQAAQKQAVENAALQAKTFKDTSATPEAGSPAAELVGAEA